MQIEMSWPLERRRETTQVGRQDQGRMTAAAVVTGLPGRIGHADASSRLPTSSITIGGVACATALAAIAAILLNPYSIRMRSGIRGPTVWTRLAEPAPSIAAVAGCGCAAAARYLR